MHKNQMSAALKEAYESGYKHGADDERKECALLCDTEVALYEPYDTVTQFEEGQLTMAEYLASQIRARGEVK